MSKAKSKSPVDLSDNFKKVNNRRKNRNRLKIMAGFLLFFLVFVLVSTFFLPKSRTNVDFKETKVDEHLLDTQNSQLVDVNEIVLQQSKKNNLMNEQTDIPSKPVEVKVNLYHQPSVQDEEVSYKVDTKKLGEFFSSSKNSNSLQGDSIQQEAKNRSVQSFTPSAHNVNNQVQENETPLNQEVSTQNQPSEEEQTAQIL